MSGRKRERERESKEKEQMVKSQRQRRTKCCAKCHQLSGKCLQVQTIFQPMQFTYEFSCKCSVSMWVSWEQIVQCNGYCKLKQRVHNDT